MIYLLLHCLNQEITVRAWTIFLIKKARQEICKICQFFNILFSNISDLYLEDWWKQLQLHNKQSYKERLLKNITPWYILTPQVTELIFLMSEILHQPPEVRYLTTEILDRCCSFDSTDRKYILWNITYHWIHSWANF